ncbi:MAG: hypothetical protein WC344_00895 [Bacilli bacterium]|jgi:hypothetical protein
MKQKAHGSKALVLVGLSALLMVGCGGVASDYDILKSEADASGEEVPCGEYDNKKIVFAYGNARNTSEEEALYIALDYGSSAASARYFADPEEQLVFFPELGSGFVEGGTVSFEYEATIDLEAGTSSDVGNIVNQSGTATANDIAYVKDFLDAAVDGLQSFLTQCHSAEQRGETWVIERLENMGYVFTVVDDAETLTYMQNQIKNQYSIDVTVQKRYMGYVTVEEHTWNAEVIVFANEEQSTAYFYKRYNGDNHGSQYSHHYRTRNVYVFSNWKDAWIEVSSSAAD